MNEAKQEILNIIANYCKENPNQRFAQILFNLNINEFKEGSEEIRDIYDDSDQKILERLQERIKQLKNK
ncbi:hypothetical protein QK342_00275 [Myroides odoratimimus]|uniref:hypothetical protein n=1 Tax=Myroides TaxID=76831 RepID=UPI00103FFA32|nr:MULTISPECIES: hypothetical protein [Myroides]MBB1140996.1 hypothetical protein [Myroides sp. WP-1]QBK74909.1 hypothetical protein E0Z07_00280 [Myroides odoratimimus]WHT73585.1 hypothetical protein QK342_00275 [Myroides odoratimimus]WHU38167.1 hypothetical protein QNM93_00275 [Myroides odoratimimus]